MCTAPEDMVGGCYYAIPLGSREECVNSRWKATICSCLALVGVWIKSMPCLTALKMSSTVKLNCHIWTAGAASSLNLSFEGKL